VKAPSISGVLVDVGGVLVDLDGVPSLTRLLGVQGSHDDIHRRWLACGSVVLHETGRISAQEFSEQVVRDLGVDVTASTFMAEFEGWLVGPISESCELIDEIPASYQVCALSNMSETHWNRIVQLGLPRRLESSFVSHQTGHLKPSPEAFIHALTQMDLTPPEVLFLDDGAANVGAARGLGMAAEVVRNAAEIRRALTDYGVLSPSPSAPPV